MATEYRSWGRIGPPARRVAVLDPASGSLPPGPILPYGNGRSYGDVCLNSGGLLLDARPLSQVASFDPATGVIRCQAGLLLSQLLEATVPHGWFLPVTPGTKYVTVGGAIANDVHGKNHHRAGTLGRHLIGLDLLRSDGRRLYCSHDQHGDLFRATIGGLGLTGLIVRCDLQLKPVQSRRIDVVTTRFGNLADFFALSAESDQRFEYTVSWVDCLAQGASQGRGWFLAGNHASEPGPPRRSRRPLRVPLTPPVSLVNRVSLQVFNWLYYHRPVPRLQAIDFEPFFYPLDALLDWNRLYGPRGFFQFQCVVPQAVGEPAMRELLQAIAVSGEGSFLAVLKQFGSLASPGLMSFPRPGPTLAIDFPNRGERTLRLLRALETIAIEAGGALYPAKDACMSAEAFRRSYPNWQMLERQRDPAFRSDFWHRVTTVL